ncbi:hypothetical protein J7T55_008953 [Diaporthe amygdali]|uniref:uncharacterized protein n=1 Tax=Phomopsis amygdali TaxID=1214568 RepID=UPI0022FE8FE2|nr:uncharacterized protein J7T55_008953 [Diaporthe amygdali]KAJ0121786.1 hypothetical protein J7T55_008953 [Diaporthe amygdali]
MNETGRDEDEKGRRKRWLPIRSTGTCTSNPGQTRACFTAVKQRTALPVLPVRLPATLIHNSCIVYIVYTETSLFLQPHALSLILLSIHACRAAVRLSVCLGIIRIDLSTQDGNALVERADGFVAAAIASLRFACIASTRLPVSSHTHHTPDQKRATASTTVRRQSRPPGDRVTSLTHSLTHSHRARAWVASPQSRLYGQQLSLSQPSKASLRLCLCLDTVSVWRLWNKPPPDAPGPPARHPPRGCSFCGIAYHLSGSSVVPASNSGLAQGPGKVHFPSV